MLLDCPYNEVTDTTKNENFGTIQQKHKKLTVISAANNPNRRPLQSITNT